MIKTIDNFLNKITTYRLLLYYLIGLLLAAMGLSLTGNLSFSTSSIFISATILVVACVVINKIFALIFKAPTNLESAYVTALILALIIAPTSGFQKDSMTFLLAASGLAMASKYLLTINKKHIFNPAAIAVALTAIGPKQSADWWVGTTAMLPFVVIGGLFLVRKIRRFQMVLTFFVSTLVATILYTLIAKGSVATSLHNTLLTSAMFFLGFVMLSEPLTTPPTATRQKWYAVLAGFLFPPQVHIFSQYSTPELDLVVSNVFSYIISPKTKLFPMLKDKLVIANNTMSFIFNPGKKFSYQPGQYMEFTLPHRGTDSRGDRRIFTLASSPTEEDLMIGVKFYKPSSSFKKALLKADDTTVLSATQISGDFVLPSDEKQKLAFIAGGIGVTPYRSMAKFLLDNHETRDITMLYSAKTLKDFAYSDVFEHARKIGLNTNYLVNGKIDGEPRQNLRQGTLNPDMIKAEIPDFRERLFYISGPQPMVEDLKRTLLRIGVPHHLIKTDFFSGYA